MKRRIVTLVLGFVIWGCISSVQAGSKINIDVQTILAETGASHIDGALPHGMIKELRSVFKYSSYRLLGKHAMHLGMQEAGKAQLPGKRMLQIVPRQMINDRVQLQIHIFKKKRRIFQTMTQLRHGASIIVGGPDYQKGVLLFNISASF